MAKNGSVDKNVIGFIMVAFLLLAALFGMQIMAFIFGQLGEADNIPDLSKTVDSLTGAHINSTEFTIPEALDSNFTGNFVVTNAVNATNSVVIPVANFTVDAATGNITNATVASYLNVNLTYSFTFKGVAEITAEEVNNNSLVAISTYTEQADTQFNTVAIAITLVVLILVFLIFWRIFIKPTMGRSKGGDAGGNFG